MFSDLVAAVNGDYIDFPPSLPSRGEIENEDGTVRTLTLEETRALLEFDLLKDEAIRMQQTRLTTGEVKYAMPSARDHDDRVYCLALFASHLMAMRKANERGGGDTKTDFATYLMSKIGEQRQPKVTNPFAGLTNPFRR